MHKKEFDSFRFNCYIEPEWCYRDIRHVTGRILICLKLSPNMQTMLKFFGKVRKKFGMLSRNVASSDGGTTLAIFPEK